MGLLHPSTCSAGCTVSASRKALEPSQESDMSVLGQPPYEIAGVDLSTSWVELVRQNKVSASMSLPPTNSNAKDNHEKDDNENIGTKGNIDVVEFGIQLVKMYTEDSNQTKWIFKEFVHQLGLEGSDSSPNQLISNINATLTRYQQRNKSIGSGVEFQRVGYFVAQLQLVRTLRPPPSEGFKEATTCNPPTYNPEIDSFVTGPLRLELRPLVGRLQSPNVDNESDDNDDNHFLTTAWDVFHNISPADVRGHFLLLPSLSNEQNWRGQYFTKSDCHDLVHLTSTIEPAGSLFIGYNSVGAGASQNHIHCHLFPHPQFDSTKDDSEDEGKDEDITDSPTGNNVYAVNNVESIYDFCDIDGGKVEVSYLKYPVFCIQMSSSVANLDLLGKALSATLEAVGDAPHNIGFLNRIYQGEDDEDAENEPQDSIEKMVDVFVFARSKERSSILPTLKLGVSEMMGVFHAQSDTELNALTAISVVTKEDGDLDQKSAMEQALVDVTFEKEEELWNSIVEKLEALQHSG